MASNFMQDSDLGTRMQLSERFFGHFMSGIVQIVPIYKFVTHKCLLVVRIGGGVVLHVDDSSDRGYHNDSCYHSAVSLSLLLLVEIALKHSKKT